MIKNDRMIFHTFTMADCDDPEIYAAGPMLAWEGTEMGEWVMKHCIDPCYRISSDPDTWGFKVVIYGSLTNQDATYFTLKYK